METVRKTVRRMREAKERGHRKMATGYLEYNVH
jgi:hypothetical protein